MTAVTGLAIEQEKLTLYLLNLNHPDGRSKAKFFLAHGFLLQDPEDLADALILHATRLWPGQRIVTPYADKRVLIGPIDTPNGTQPIILSVWQIRADERAWLVTARPHNP